MLKILGSLLRSKGLTVFLSLTVIVLSLYFGLTFELQNRTDAELTRLSERGARVRLQDFQQPPVADDDNAAPCYMAALDLNSLGMSNTLARFATTKGLQEGLDTKSPELERFLKDRATTLTLLAEGYDKPDCRFPYNTTQGYRAMQGPSYLAVQSLTRFVSIQSLVDIQRGRTTEAIEESQHLLRFVARLKYGDSLLQTMTKIACGKVAVKPLEELARQGVRADYSNLLTDLDAVVRDQKTALIRSVEAERAMAVDFLEQARNGRGALADAALSAPVADRILYTLVGRPLLLVEVLNLLQNYDRIERGLRENSVEEMSSPSPSMLPGHVLSDMLLPNLKRANEVDREYQAQLEHLRSQLEALNTH